MATLPAATPMIPRTSIVEDDRSMYSSCGDISRNGSKYVSVILFLSYFPCYTFPAIITLSFTRRICTPPPCYGNGPAEYPHNLYHLHSSWRHTAHSKCVFHLPNSPANSRIPVNRPKLALSITPFRINPCHLRSLFTHILSSVRYRSTVQYVCYHYAV